MRENVKRFTIDIPLELHHELKMFCVAQNISMRNAVLQATEMVVQNYKNNKSKLIEREDEKGIL